MDGFFYASVEGFEVQVYSDSPADLRTDAVIYLRLDDEAYSRAELWFIDRTKDEIPENRIAAGQTSGSGAFLAYFRSAKMGGILDLLRDRNRVWFTWDQSKVAALRTGQEPVEASSGDTG